MRAYWSDREQKKPPVSAQFVMREFSSLKTRRFSPEWVSLPLPKLLKVKKKTFSPTFPVWKKNIEAALKQIASKKIEKVVLGRICTLELEEKIDPFAVTAALEQNSVGTFVFCLEQNDYAFLGASPERLFQREDLSIQVEAIAGTSPRGKTQKEDEEKKRALLSSEKDLREFLPVQRFLEEKLTPLCLTPFSFSPIQTHQTPYVHHLCCKGKNVLKEPFLGDELLNLLHPTPALCGAPSSKAFSLIKSLEPFKRHLFGGIVGWEFEKTADYIVGIRSAYLKEKTMILFSATGIVEGSDPEKEWEELNQKIALYDRIMAD